MPIGNFFSSEFDSDKMIIAGAPLNAGATAVKMAASFVLAPVGIGLWKLADSSETGMMWGTLSLIAVVIALFLPTSSCEFIDFAQRKVGKESWYLFFRTTFTELPFEHFSHIVVRHLCHPGGEGDDTFTGAVGFKPADGGAVLWVKEFPATKDEMPTAPDGFARKLAALTGISYRGYPFGNVSNHHTPQIS